MPVWSPGLHASRHADPNNEERIAIERIKIGIFEEAATALQLQHHDSEWHAPSNKRGRELPDRSPSAESNTSSMLRQWTPHGHGSWRMLSEQRLLIWGDKDLKLSIFEGMKRRGLSVSPRGSGSIEAYSSSSGH